MNKIRAESRTEWIKTTLRDITEKIGSGITPRGGSSVYTDKGVMLIRSQNVQNEVMNFDDVAYITMDMDAKMKATRLKKGDVLYNITGASIGRSAVFDYDYPANVNQHVCIIRLKDTSSQFINYWLRSIEGARELYSFQAGGNREGINFQQLGSFVISLPGIEEQKRIVRVLETWDRAIALVERKIACKRAVKQWLMQQLLTGQRRLPGFSGGWETKSLAELEETGAIEMSRGNVISNVKMQANPGLYPVYSSSVKNNGLFGKYSDYMFDEELVTWSVDGGGNFFYRPKHKFSITNVCGYMRCLSSEINTHFLALQLQIQHERQSFDYTFKAHPSVIRTIYNTCLPAKDEQDAIASVVSNIDKEINLITKKLTLLKDQKKYLLNNLVTGAIRTPEDI